MTARRAVPTFAWVSALIAFALYVAILIGVSVARDALTTPVAGWFSLGHLLVLVTHVLPPALAIAYLRRTPVTSVEAASSETDRP